METFEVLTKKTKQKNRRQIILISVTVVVSFLAIYAGLMFVSGKLLNRNFRKVMDYYHQRDVIAYPNMHVIGGNSPKGQFSSTYHLDRMKDIDGVFIPYRDINASATLFATHVDSESDFVKYPIVEHQGELRFSSNQSTYRNPVFFNTRGDWNRKYAPKPSQELPLTKEMKGQLVEVALTFDKPYSYQELQTMLPENLKKNWFWFGTTNTEIDYSYSLADIYGLSFEEKEDEMSYDILPI
ncbi:anti sigma factor C-terminal domain-containing protein [Streptococcus sp. ZJ93]|uniref:anti sigma factor C-terminal domain-containing protein n=1 Tax=Streptococcus handemini TaxID=3161188 RepID=UPI0032EFCF5D